MELVDLPAGFDVIAEYEQLFDVLTEGLEKTEEELSEALETADELAGRASMYLLEAGGKRVRPLLTLLSGLTGDPAVATGEVSKISQAVRDVAVAMELTHLATLYHDDVMDEADQRRGVPSAHVQWSNSVAILAGDLIVARASRRMAARDVKSLMIHTETFEQLVMGQLYETVGPKDGENPLDHYLKVVHGKTASLLSSTALLGAYHGGASEEVANMMAEYGSAVGMAFQLADDIIDVTSASDESGKVRGTDLKERVATLPVLLLRDLAQAGNASAQYAIELVDGPLETTEQLAAAVDAVSSSAAIDEAWAITRDWSAQALRAIEGLAESPVKSALISFAQYVVNRSS